MYTFQTKIDRYFWFNLHQVLFNLKETEIKDDSESLVSTQSKMQNFKKVLWDENMIYLNILFIPS